ncbi:MAG TPA: TetR/AcrR family transcriptional regulator [Fibrobacteraceae bacterium]|nr:TetR/AcrR family transcriptional regulator [Fibrobacteraceae bacterium]
MTEEQNTREKILQAARQEFIENGLRGARMQEIADRAGINKALLHYHFRDKENLYDAALQSVLLLPERLLEIFSEDAPKGLELEMAVRRLVDMLIGTLQENPDLVGMVLRELADGGTCLDVLLNNADQLFQKAFVQVSSCYRNAMENGTAQTFSLPHMMISVMSMAWGTFILRPIYGRVLKEMGLESVLQGDFYADRSQKIADLVLAGILKKG